MRSERRTGSEAEPCETTTTHTLHGHDRLRVPAHARPVARTRPRTRRRWDSRPIALLSLPEERDKRETGRSSQRDENTVRTSAGGKTGNDPSAGSPTETLLRLLLPLNNKLWTASQSVASGEPAASPQSGGLTGSFHRWERRAVCTKGRDVINAR